MEKYGTIWRDEELDEIVADYFSMLSAELSKASYVKSHHSAALMAKIGRSHRSVEFKHQNISAVLAELGMPWIPGYKPKLNYQNAIFDAIDRYLSTHTQILQPSVQPRVVAADATEIFVPSPELKPPPTKPSERLDQLVRKFDPVKRDHLNRSLGAAGEEFVVNIEKRRLTDALRPDLAQKVRWISFEDGDGAGYDVASFRFSGDPLYIEVKTTNGPARTPFFLSRNEVDVADRNANLWLIYRVHFFATDPRIFTIAPPLGDSLRLTTETWRASF